MCLLWLENRECLRPDPAHPQKALGVKLPDRWSRAEPVFDDEHLVSCAGLVPVMGLAEQTGLAELIGQRVRFKASKGRLGGSEPGREADRDRGRDGSRRGLHRRSRRDPRGGMRRLFGGVYAPATLGQFLREFTHGHTLQLASVLRAHLVNLVEATVCCPASPSRCSSTWTRCCDRSSATPNKARATATPRSRASRCSARACRRWRPRCPPRPGRR